MRRNMVQLNLGSDLPVRAFPLQVVSRRRPFPTTTLRTGRAAFTASGSPISRSFLSRLYASHVPSRVLTVFSTAPRPVPGITLGITA
jgi:hypothetical protein